MTTTVAWHHDVNLSDGTPYPLRHQLSAYALSQPVLSDTVLGLTEKQSRTSTAVHELGHAVLWMAHGLRITELAVGVGPAGPGGRAECGPVAPDKRLGWAIAIVAGERATDRWLRETGLWTEDLAAMAELGAAHDRALIFAADPEPRPEFGTGAADYADLHDLADRALDEQWDRIMATLPRLVRAGHMTGAELAACTGLANAEDEA